MVTIEKWHGACSEVEEGTNCPSEVVKAYPCCEEDRIITDLQRIKKINPQTTTVMYFNLVM